MVKVQAIINFNYKNYDKIKEFITDKKQEGKINLGDIFVVENKEALYLLGENKDKIVAVKALEVIPEIKEERNITAKGKNKKKENI